MVSIIEHFSDLFGEDQAFYWKKWNIKVKHFSWKTEKHNVQKPILSFHNSFHVLGLKGSYIGLK